MASGIPALEMVFSLNSMGPPSTSARFWFLSSNLPYQHEHGIIKFIHHALFQRDDRIVGDVDLLGAHLGAAFGDVAQADAEFVLEHAGARLRIERVHFESRNPDEKPRSSELLYLMVLAEYVTHILAQEALNTLAKLLHPVHI